MMTFAPRTFAVLACALSLSAGITYAKQASDTQPRNLPKVTIAGSELRSMHSIAAGREIDLYIRVPSNYNSDKTKKYPAIYILDGQWDFKLMDSVLGGLVYDKFVPEAILVGITYSGDNADYDGLRAMDYTPTAVRDVKGSGNGPNFLKCLKTELIPYIEANYRADPSHRVLQGSSYAGLFTLYAMFADTGLFSGYIAASPAVPYGNGFAFKQEAEYAQTHKELPVRLFLSVGSAEGLSGPVRTFMQTLQSRGYQGLKLETRVIEGERHAGNKPEAFNRGLRFVFAE
ncbi:MAG: alpha/beta hydrolase-fold protein [Bryobacteraceae bacterium]